MREIKFRAWDNLNKRMITSGIFFNNTLMQLKTAPNIELMQYTGLKDKNGKEIYEGDIVEVSYYDYTEEGCELSNHQVVWCNDYPAFDLEPHIDYESNALQYVLHEYPVCKVIGNLYENPELLED